MPISFKKQLIFIHIPKCAGSSVEDALGIDYKAGMRSRYGIRCKQMKVKGIENLSGIEKLYAENTSPQHLSASMLKKMLPNEFEQYTKFTIVRNPYDRLVSEYYYTNKVHDLTFNKFIKNVFNLSEFERNTKFDSHLNTQKSFVYDKHQLLVDKIFHFEQIENVFDWLNVPMTHENSSIRPSSYMHLYTPELLQLVNYMYQDDFTAFGYEMQ